MAEDYYILSDTDGIDVYIEVNEVDVISQSSILMIIIINMILEL